MKDYQSLNHTKWDCKYHVVFIPKRRRKQIYGALRKYLGEMFHELARQKESQDSGRTSVLGSCPHVREYSAQICGVERDRISSRARVRSQLQGISQRESETLQEKAFGLEDIMSQPWDWMRRR